ncbi:MAG: universal stress protein, partial [Flammeovirgaceae bacterium]
ELLNIITIGIAVKKNQAGEYESIKESAKDFIDQVIGTAKKRLTQFKEAVAHKEVKLLTKVLVAEDSKSLVNMIMENEHDLLVVSGKREHKLADVFDVPIREKVIQLAHCPVLIINEKVEYFDVRKMVFATQFRQEISQIVDSITSLKQLFNATGDLLYVNTHHHFKTTYEIEDTAERFMDKYGLTGFNLTIFCDKKAEDGIMRYSERSGADLTIVCTDGSNWMTQLFQGHIANNVVNESPKPVLIYNLARIQK